MKHVCMNPQRRISQKLSSRHTFGPNSPGAPIPRRRFIWPCCHWHGRQYRSWFSSGQTASPHGPVASRHKRTLRGERQSRSRGATQRLYQSRHYGLTARHELLQLDPVFSPTRQGRDYWTRYRHSQSRRHEASIRHNPPPPDGPRGNGLGQLFVDGTLVPNHAPRSETEDRRPDHA